MIGISIHAPLAGRDPAGGVHLQPTDDFNPRAPCGARPRRKWTHIRPSEFQSTRPLRGATVRHRDRPPPMRGISIHAPLAGRDPHTPASRSVSCRFQSTRPLRGATEKLKAYEDLGFISIHAPLAGRDDATWSDAMWAKIFQSTRPLRGATSLRIPRRRPAGISIHAPLAGCDTLPSTTRP